MAGVSGGAGQGWAKAQETFLSRWREREHQRLLWCFEMRDRRQPTLQLGDELLMNLIEPPSSLEHQALTRGQVLYE